MRPRGESISCPHKTYVGHTGKQNPQWTHFSMISFEGGWCASKALAHSCFAVKSSLRCHPQSGQDSACSWDQAASLPHSLRATHRQEFPKRRTPASCPHDGARQVNRPCLANRHATSEAPRATLPACLPNEAIRCPSRTSALSTGADECLTSAPPFPSCSPCLPARC